MVTTITKRERKFEVKLLQLRITAGIRQKLQRVSKRSGLDTSALARLCLASGLPSIERHLPSEPTAERDA
jgi:antitoxin component of RelBE/YafQ-DinJ toxin-antitoxin module